MSSLMLALWLLVASAAGADCAGVDAAVIDSHAGWAFTAWKADDTGRFTEVHELLLEDLACVAGSGLRTRNTELFLVLARGALEAGDEPRALAALRAVLVIDGSFVPEVEMVPYDQPLAPLFAMAQALGPDVAGFKSLFLGQDPAALVGAPAPVPTGPTPEQLEAQRREELLARVHHEIETDAKARKVGAITAAVGGITCGLSLSFIAARNTSGENKTDVVDMPYREQMAKVWTSTAIGGAATMGAGLWLMKISQLDAGTGTPLPTLGWGWRF